MRVILGHKRTTVTLVNQFFMRFLNMHYGFGIIFISFFSNISNMWVNSVYKIPMLVQILKAFASLITILQGFRICLLFGFDTIRFILYGSALCNPTFNPLLILIRLIITFIVVNINGSFRIKTWEIWGISTTCTYMYKFRGISMESYDA